MKMNHFKRIFSILVISYLFIPMCDVKNPTEDVNVIIKTDPITTIVSGIIVDARTDEPIQDRVEITVEGQNQQDVISLSGSKQTEFITENGVIAFALTEQTSPSENNPVELIVQATVSGYLPNTLRLDLVETGSKTFKIYLINLSNSPPGVAVTTGQFQTDENGIVQEDVVIKAIEPVTGGTAELNIPQGIQIKDDNDNPLTGMLNVLFVYNSNQTDESLNTFPGGFAVTANRDGVIQEGIFITGGWTTTLITDQNGSQASSLKSSLKANSAILKSDLNELTANVKLPISANTYNPETSDFVKVGDLIDIWRYYSDPRIYLNEWRLTSNQVVQASNGGDLFVSFPIQIYTREYYVHNYDVLIEIVPQMCFQIKLVILGNEKRYPLLIRTKLANGTGYLSTINNVIDEVNFIRTGAPDIPFIIEAYSDCGNEKAMFGSVVVSDFCSDNEIYLNVTVSDIDITHKTIQVSGYCSCLSGMIVRPSGIPIWYQNTSCGSGSWIFAGIANDGEIEMDGLHIGATYIFLAYYEGRIYRMAATIHADYSVYAPEFSTQNYIKEVNVDGDVIEYVVQLPDEACVSLCDQY